MRAYSARVDRSGRLVLPAAIRNALELRDGDEVTFLADPAAHDIRLMTRDQAVRTARELVARYVSPDVDLVAELFADRRRDVRREQA